MTSEPFPTHRAMQPQPPPHPCFDHAVPTSEPSGAASFPVLLATGAASGIGAAIALRAARPGASLVLLDRDEAGLRGTAGRVRDLGADVLEFPLDLRDGPGVQDAFARAVERFGAVHQVAQAAGILRPGRLHEVTDADLLDHYAANVLGVLHVLQSAAAHLPSGGSVAVVSSNAARVPRTGLAAYAASKAAASALTRCAGLELAAQGIRCNVVEPGSTRTPMQRDLWPDPLIGEDTALRGDPAEFRTGIPLGRIAEPQDVADVVLFLLSDSARHLTLQQLFVDGGASL